MGCHYPFLTQKERDSETGLDYFLARYYSSTQGRFTTPDEFTGEPDELYYFVDAARDNPTFYADLTNPQSLNKYQYVYNNPLRYTDDDGHCGALCVRLVQVAVRTPAGRQLIRATGAAVTTAIVAASGAVQKAFEKAHSMGGGQCLASVGCPPAGVLQLRREQNAQQNILNKNNSGEQGKNGNQQQGENSREASGQKPGKQVDPGGDIQKLSKDEIKKLQDGEVDIHELKGGKGASRYDLYKDKKGDIYVYRKGGKGEGESTGLNIKDY